MARRYRYSFAKKKEAEKGKWSVGVFVISFLLLPISILSVLFVSDKMGFLIGGMGLFAALLSVYGFVMGLTSFSEEGKSHRTSIVGSIANGVLMIIWLGVFLTGV